MKTKKTLALLVSSIALLATTATHAESLTTYSEATVKSASVLYYNTIPSSTVTSYTGSPATLSASSNGYLTYAYWTGSKYKFIPVADSVFASADLASGQLKTYASVSIGSSTGAAYPVNTNSASASATARFADSFSAYSGSTPFLWSNNDTAHFSFSVDGTTSIPAAATSIASQSSYTSAYTELTFLAYKPGGLALSNQLKNFDWNGYSDFDVAYGVFQTLADQLIALSIGENYWILGQSLNSGFDPSHFVGVNSGTPTTINFDFNPSGDFEWELVLDSHLMLDASLQNVTATIDFSHTIAANYVGPDGTTTYSASGLFPSTAPSAVPVPAAAWLFGSSLLGLAGLARKRKAA